MIVIIVRCDAVGRFSFGGLSRLLFFGLVFIAFWLCFVLVQLGFHKINCGFLWVFLNAQVFLLLFWRNILIHCTIDGLPGRWGKGCSGGLGETYKREEKHFWLRSALSNNTAFDKKRLVRL
ncbi:hypothetical protein BJV82DRAFT_202129 [Fennellomyces sp. T-0311]|nr:hypothetical protein BJV82DRAFT_202129 [Fennellomyces sp. T-0311]